MNKRNFSYIMVAATLLATTSIPTFGQQKCQNLSAITTASLKLTTQSKACETTADFYFTFNETNGSRIFSYGTTTSYGTEGGNAAGSSRSKTINLTGLKPDTKYYFKVVGEYEGRTRYTMTGTFTTQANAVPVLNEQTAIKQNTLISIGKNVIKIPQNSDRSLTVELFSINGAQIMKHTLDIGSSGAYVPLELTNGNGTYLCKITGQHTSFSQKIILSN